MALNIGRKRQTTDETKAERPWTRMWPRRTSAPASETADRTAPPDKTVVVERKPSRWRRSRHNPISAIILAAGWAAAVILVMGMLLTWGDANPDNMLVDAVLDTGRWLATPFHDVFTRSNPDHQLYINWGIAAGVYYLMARTLSWLTRF